MSPFRHEGDQKTRVEDWGSHVDQMIRDAQAHGDFDNLPGAGKPIRWDDEGPYGAEWATAFRMAKNAGAAPLWVELEKEIGTEREAMLALADRTARYLARQASLLADRQQTTATQPPATQPSTQLKPSPQSPRRGRSRWSSWLFGLPRWHGDARIEPSPEHKSTAVEEHLVGPATGADLEAERLRARERYLAMAATVDTKIQEFNHHRPRQLVWLEKPRLLPVMAAAEFDSRCPPLQ